MRHQLLTIGIASFTYLWPSVRPCDTLKALSLLDGNRVSPIYTAYDHPPLCQIFGIRGDYNLQLVSNGFLGANPALIRDSNPPSALFSGISDATLPTYLGLWPIALHNLPLPQQHYIFSSVLLSHFQPNTDAGHLVLFEDCGSILLAVGRLDYIVITSYVSQLVNLLRTRTPMGDLAGMEVIETSYYG